MSQNNTLKNLTLTQLKNLLPKELLNDLHSECHKEINELKDKFEIMSIMYDSIYNKKYVSDIRYAIIILHDKNYLTKYAEFILENINIQDLTYDLTYFFQYGLYDYIEIFKIMKPLFDKYIDLGLEEKHIYFTFFNDIYPIEFLNYLKSIDYIKIYIKN